METNDKNDRRENIQQQPDKDKESKKPETPVPPQRKDPQAKPTSDGRREK
ncbi:hypothetical protein [Nafulsella turpanensis]|nr:hypothetical protein [Nafulsella turpanensis]